MDEKQETSFLLTIRDIYNKLSAIDTKQEQILDGLEDLKSERTSKIEVLLEKQSEALKSIRAAAPTRTTLQSLIEFEGPGGVRGKLLGFGGFTVVLVVLVAVAAGVAYLLLRQ